MKTQRKIKETDYLFEVSVRVAIREEDAAAFLEKHEYAAPEDDDTEEDRLAYTIMDIAGQKFDNDVFAGSSVRLISLEELLLPDEED